MLPPGLLRWQASLAEQGYFLGDQPMWDHAGISSSQDLNPLFCRQPNEVREIADARSSTTPSELAMLWR